MTNSSASDNQSFPRRLETLAESAAGSNNHEVAYCLYAKAAAGAADPNKKENYTRLILEQLGKSNKDSF